MAVPPRRGWVCQGPGTRASDALNLELEKRTRAATSNMLSQMAYKGNTLCFQAAEERRTCDLEKSLVYHRSARTLNLQGIVQISRSALVHLIRDIWRHQFWQDRG